MAHTRNEYQSQCAAMCAPPPPPDLFPVRPTRYNYEAKIPNQPTYNTESTLHHDKPEYLLGPERLVSNNAWVTTNGLVHDRKFYREERDFQPKHPQAPSQHKLHFVMPDHCKKIQGVSSRNMKAYNPQPFKNSETHAEFTPHYADPSMFGQAGIFLTDHFVHMPENRVNVRPAFTYDDMFSVMRKAHPYMTTYRIHHKNFEDELPYIKFLDSLYNAKDTDVAIKLRVRPMLDPFEQTFVREGTLPSLDIHRENPGGAKRDFAHLKHFFRKPPYQGCYPRVHQPVPHLGLGTTYKDSFDRPFHPNMAYNFHNDENFCFLQPRQSMMGLSKVPAMYEKESQILGSGRSVTRYIDTDIFDTVAAANEMKEKARRQMSDGEGMTVTDMPVGKCGCGM